MAFTVNGSAPLPQLSQRIIPEDIWTHIAKFIPDQDLPSMLSVNGTFFQLGMNAKYRWIRLDDFSEVSAALKRLHRLRTPDVARRVNHLSVHLDPRPLYQRSQSYGKLEGDAWGRSHGRRELYEVLQAITNTVPCFTNVTKFTFQWTLLLPEEPLGPFFTEAWNTFGSTLQTLTLKSIPPSTLPTILYTTEDFPALQRLHVEFHQQWLGYLLGPSDTYTTAAGNALAQFANKAAPTLRDLHIVASSYEGVPLTFFRHLGNLPSLERLTIFFDTYSSPDQILDLIYFLQTHAVTLRHIRWEFPTDGPVIQNYLDAMAFDRVFANLISLDMVVPWPPSGFVTIVQCISRSIDTLTSLILRGHYMENDEVDMLASIFESRQSRSLQTLDIRVESLSSELIPLLARIFPRLEHLAVGYTELSGNDVLEDMVLARNFADAIRKYNIRNWLLLDIKFSNDSGSEDEGIDNMLMELVAECVPSVHKFCGVEKQDWRASQHDMMPYSNNVWL